MPLYKPDDIILNGKYRIERLLGAGAFGEVYLSTHLDLGMQRAIKVAHRNMPGFGSTRFEEAFDRFRQEAQIGARLKHDNLITVYDFYDGEKSLHLVMEYAAGGSLEDELQQKLDKGETFSVEETITILKDVASGLAVLHDQRNPIVHRDLKPSNILFDAEGHAKIADLGLAQVPGGLSQRSRLGSVAQSHPGTPAYMSPEQEKTEAMLRPTSDIYTLGVIAFEMLTGVNYNMARPGTQVQEYRTDVEREVNDLILEMLKEESKQRPWDGGELLIRLQKLDQALEVGKNLQPEQKREEEQEQHKKNQEEQRKEQEGDQRHQELAARQKQEEETRRRQKENEDKERPNQPDNKIEVKRELENTTNYPQHFETNPSQLETTRDPKQKVKVGDVRRNYFIGGMVVLVIGLLWVFFANQRPAPTVYNATAIVHSAATETKQTSNTPYQSIINNESVDDPFRVAFVTSGRIDDHAFSQSMYEQLLKLQKEMGEDQFEFVSSDGMYVVDEASAVIQDYASQDFDLVVIHGSQYESAIQQIAPNYPEVSFAWGNSQETFGYDNVFAYDVYAQEGGYVLGVMAAALNRSGVIGIVNPIEFGDAKLYTEGFIAGVKATNPYITVNVINTGSYIDVALAAESAQAHVAAGADILTGSGQMVVGAIEVARINGVLWFGTQADQTSISPEIVVANQIYDWSIILRDMISLINEGNLGNKSYVLSLENKGLNLAYNPNYNLPADVKSIAESTIKGIIEGLIIIGVDGR